MAQNPPAQQQDRPGTTDEMDPRPRDEMRDHVGKGLLEVPGDLSEESECESLVGRTVADARRVDLVINNLATQEPRESLLDIPTEQWERTFRTSVSSYPMRRAADPDEIAPSFGGETLPG